MKAAGKCWRAKTAIVFAAVVGVLSGCGGGNRKAAAQSTGAIVFAANGEDFVRRGFVDKQGWSISFDKLYVNIGDVVAYMPVGKKLSAVLDGEHWVDLAQGDDDAEPIEIGRIDSVPAGNYQSLRFGLTRAESGEYKGCTIVMIGEARKDTATVAFTIRLDEEMDFDGREGFVGDEIKGVLKPGGSTTVEITFHFDHLFGDNEAPQDDHVNTGAVGFDFFNDLAEHGVVNVTQARARSAEGYATLLKAIWTLGHLGEGHCAVSNQSSAKGAK